MLRAWAIFFGTLGILRVVEEFHRDAVREVATHANAWLSAGALRVLGAEARSEGSQVDSSLFDFNIIFECTAVYPMALFVAAVLAYPAPWRPKLLGIALGLPALVFLNLVRIVSLIYIGHWYRPAFETAHLLVWQSLIVFLTVLLWVLWASLVVGRDASRPA